MGKAAAKKNGLLRDWHPADVVAAVRKTGTSLAALSHEHGYTHPQTLQRALHSPWPKGERIIAARLGLRPHAIWPSRYDQSGRPNRRPVRPAKKHSSNGAHA